VLSGGERELQHLLAEPECRVCGCTSRHGCPEGCIWVEEDLCSRCAREQAQAPAEFTDEELLALERELDGFEADHG
jgi:hypothetical protein